MGIDHIGCDQDGLNIFLLPQHLVATNQVWLQSAQWLWRSDLKEPMNGWMDTNTCNEVCLSYKLSLQLR